MKAIPAREIPWAERRKDKIVLLSSIGSFTEFLAKFIYSKASSFVLLNLLTAEVWEPVLSRSIIVIRHLGFF